MATLVLGMVTKESKWYSPFHYKVLEAMDKFVGFADWANLNDMTFPTGKDLSIYE